MDYQDFMWKKVNLFISPFSKKWILWHQAAPCWGCLKASSVLSAGLLAMARVPKSLPAVWALKGLTVGVPLGAALGGVIYHWVINKCSTLAQCGDVLKFAAYFILYLKEKLYKIPYHLRTYCLGSHFKISFKKEITNALEYGDAPSMGSRRPPPSVSNALLTTGSDCGWYCWSPLNNGDAPWRAVSFVVSLHQLWSRQSCNCAVSQVFHRVSRCGCSQENCLGGSNLSQV